ncbi:hypothetical protein GLOTRDRAFT_133884 [Gloeophyllum trabeum ATCC 11539]|uniref:Uncharacterized protein n=1 Tax=Gloeophyllum trabeum (strain ATCC 11539 / FP-39264 / Madison 617) TaxID=670483 RepID=S7RDL8_GLOTA|nr:uncharacterized protein GLOTRDRAFT_133884 [Gloeophyllum trabeum ATCC 11539]EPQ50514.1 hypothetical protein GLOTRDRAFT_133884 [Gloeophyllum trabeum ATCC 11539]
MAGVELARLRPLSLEELGLVFDATDVPSTAGERPARGICNENILQLYVGDSPEANTADIADFLSDFLPNMKEIVGQE